jgi:hypothetical protein
LGNEFFLPFKKNWIEKAVVPSTLSAALTADTVTVFENKEKWPRAFVVTGTDTPDLASIKMLGKEGLLAAPITEYSPHRLSIQAPPGARGVLVLTDQYYPGWRATLNGKPVGIERIAGIFRGVRVDGAGGTLVFLYRPSSFRLGAIISSVTLLFTFAGIALSLRFPAPIRT